MTASFQNLFDRQASDYARYRPGYPDSLLDFIADNAPSGKLAWDAGTGSGQAAVMLASRFEAVIATDSSAAQLEHARANPKVTYRAANAEDSGLPASSCDAITAANALHWFDIPRFFAEAKRVLKPKGVIAVWCYSDVQAPDPLKPVLERLKDKIRPFWPEPIKLVAQRYETLEFPFEELVFPDLQMETNWDLEQCLGYVSTWSAVGNYRSSTGKDPIAELKTDLPPELSQDGRLFKIVFPLPVRIGRLRS